MLVPAFLVDIKADMAEEDLEACHSSIRKIKLMTGMGKSASLPGRGTLDSSNEENDHRPIDFTAIIRDLTRVSASLAHCDYSCQMFFPMLEFLDQENHKNLESVPPEYRKRLEQANRALEGKNEFLRCWFRGAGARSRYLSQRSQAYIQTVSYAYHFLPHLPPNTSQFLSYRLPGLPNTYQHAHRTPDLQPHGPKRQCLQHPNR